MMKISPLVALCSCLATFAFAQEEAARIETQQDIATRQQTAFGQQPTELSVTDPELGDINLVLRQPRPKMFTFSTNQSLNFTSNAFLTQHNEQTAWFWNGRLDLAIIPYATRDFTPRLVLEQDWFRYDHFSELDFDSQSAQAGVKYDLDPNDRTFLDLSYTYTRLYSQHPAIGQFYLYGLLNGSVTHLISFQSIPIGLALSGGAYWRQGDPSKFDRVSPYLNVVAIRNVMQNVQLSGFVRPELQLYTNDPDKSPRADFNLSVGASVSWAPIERVTLAATASYVGNFSNVGARRYDLFTPSVLIAGQIAF